MLFESTGRDLDVKGRALVEVGSKGLWIYRHSETYHDAWQEGTHRDHLAFANISTELLAEQLFLWVNHATRKA